MVDRPFALHHHFYSRVVTGLQGYPLSYNNKQLVIALSDWSPRSATKEEEEECARSKGLVVCPSPAAGGCRRKVSVRGVGPQPSRVQRPAAS